MPKNRTPLFAGFLFGLMSAVVSNAAAESYVNDFLQSGFGSRALSMGGSFVAVADDTSASLWNPAGLSQIRRLALDSTYTNRLDDFVKEYSASFAVPLSLERRAVVGLAYYQSQIENIPINPGLTADQIQQYQSGALSVPQNSETARDSAGMVSFGMGLGKRLSMGLTGRVISRNFVGNVSGSGFGFDVGVLSHWGPLALGVNFRDVLARVDWKGRVPASNKSVDYDEKPRMASHIGAAYLFPISKGRSRLVVALGGDVQSGRVIPRLGTELQFHVYRVRLGVLQNIADTRSSSIDNRILPSLGLGLHLAPVNIQYAVSQHVLGWTHGFSIGFEWGKLPEGGIAQ